MRRRKIGDEGEARRCLDAQRASGLEPAVWARREGVDGRSLNAWRMNLARRGAGGPAPAAPRFVELVPFEESRAIVAEGPGFAVRCGRFVVDVGEAFDEASLRRLLRVLVAC